MRRFSFFCFSSLSTRKKYHRLFFSFCFLFLTEKNKMFLFFSNICSALFNAQFLLLHLLLQKFFFMLASLKGSILTNKGPIFIETSGWNVLEKKLIYKPRPFKFLPAFRHTVLHNCDGKFELHWWDFSFFDHLPLCVDIFFYGINDDRKWTFLDHLLTYLVLQTLFVNDP